MPKVGMKPIRERQIMDATMACIHAKGFAKTNIKSIAKLAGITSGLIFHYFEDKERLFEAVYRDLYRRLGEETKRRLIQADTPVEKLLGILEAQVSVEMVEPRIVATWFAIAAKAPETPRLARMERINIRRLTSNLVYTLKQVGLSRIEAKEISEELCALIYGLWSNFAHQTISKPMQARVILFRYLHARVPQLAPGGFNTQ